MGRVWDINPPSKPSRPTKKVQRRQKSYGSFLGLLIILMIGVFVYINLVPPEGSQTPMVAVTVTPTPAAELTLKLLNGSGRSEETSLVKSRLEELALTVNKTENALNLYNQTIVYYKAEAKDKADEIVAKLNDFQAKAEPFSQDSAYDIIVVIGSR